MHWRLRTDRRLETGGWQRILSLCFNVMFFVNTSLVKILYVFNMEGIFYLPNTEQIPVSWNSWPPSTPYRILPRICLCGRTRFKTLLILIPSSTVKVVKLFSCNQQRHKSLYTNSIYYSPGIYLANDQIQPAYIWDRCVGCHNGPGLNFIHKKSFSFMIDVNIPICLI